MKSPERMTRWRNLDAAEVRVFDSYTALATSLRRLMHEHRTLSCRVSVITMLDSKREQNYAAVGSFEAYIDGKNVRLVHGPEVGKLFPETEFKEWCERAIRVTSASGESQPRAYGTYGYRVAQVGPKESARVLRQKMETPDPDDFSDWIEQRAGHEIDMGESQEEHVPQQQNFEDAPEDRKEADSPEDPALPQHEVVWAPDVSDSEVIAECESIEELRKRMLSIIQDVRGVRDGAISVFVYPQDGEDIVGNGYEFVQERRGARVVRLSLPDGERINISHHKFAQTFRRLLDAEVQGTFKLVVTAARLPA